MTSSRDANLPVIILGGGGHGRVVADLLRAMGRTVLGYTDAENAEAKQAAMGVEFLGPDEEVMQTSPGEVLLAVGLGGIGDTGPRQRMFERFKADGYRFATAVHPTAIVAEGVTIGEGSQIMAGAIINPGGRIGVNAVINTGAVIDHDADIGDHVHIATGAVLSGGVKVGSRAHIGTGAAVIQSVTICAGALIAAGATVTGDVAAGKRVAGTPAKDIT